MRKPNGYSDKFRDFLLWESSSRDTIDLKRVYIDMADGDILAGLALSEILYWHLPDKQGDSKLRVFHEGRWWIASRRYEWWSRTRMTPRQSDRALAILKKNQIIAIKTYKFNGDPTKHVRLDEEKFLALFWSILENPSKNPFLPVGKNEITPTEKGNPPKRKNETPSTRKPLTETTTTIPTETTFAEGGETPELQGGGNNPASTPPTSHAEIYQFITGKSPTKTILSALPDVIPEAHQIHAADWLSLYKQIAHRTPILDQWPAVLSAFARLTPDQRTVEYLKPYWDAWCAIDAKRTNTDWLTDCAVNGRLPGRKQSGIQKPEPKRYDALLQPSKGKKP